MTISWINPDEPGWSGPDDSWSWRDDYFEAWLAETARSRRSQVMAEALTVRDPKPSPRREPKPQPHPRPRPQPKAAPTTAPTIAETGIDHFTEQQTRIAERLLGIDTKDAA